MFSESVSDFGRHDICLYTGGLRVGRIMFLWSKLPALPCFCPFCSKRSINFWRFFLSYIAHVRTRARVRARARVRFVSFAVITFADIVNIYIMNTTIHYIIVSAFRDPHVRSYPTFTPITRARKNNFASYRVFFESHYNTLIYLYSGGTT